ncbi:MAG: Gfo/Idh/MocA family oxidoreductase, partial [Verrucomicrobia bacterium]|nr:Gfo/Idh/MocA family oxidoreductase [Verrucomicrobiota bacterium]
MSNLIVPATAPVTRRSFFSTSTKFAAGAAALGALPVERFVHGASPGDTIKVALIGMGGRGSGAANQALSTGESVKLVAVADVHKDRMESSLSQLAKQHKDKVQVKDENKFMGFDAYKKAIAQADLVILATPPGFRPMQFEEAVRQGKHIFMEKPVCVDVAGYKKVIAAAAEA